MQRLGKRSETILYPHYHQLYLPGNINSNREIIYDTHTTPAKSEIKFPRPAAIEKESKIQEILHEEEEEVIT